MANLQRSTGSRGSNRCWNSITWMIWFVLGWRYWFLESRHFSFLHSTSPSSFVITSTASTAAAAVAPAATTTTTATINEKHNNVENQDSYSSLPWYARPQPLLQDWPELPERRSIHPILEQLKLKRGVEIGVQQGRLAQITLQVWKSCLEYKLVDLWGSDPNYVETGSDSNAQKNVFLNYARNKLRPWTEKNITEFFIMKSMDAVKKFEDNYFDYIYVDARHDYCAVKEDIEGYWPKLRPGGIMAGHDYVLASYAQERFTDQDWATCEDGTVNPGAVKGAVDDFVVEQKVFLKVTQEDFPTWIVQKPYE